MQHPLRLRWIWHYSQSFHSYLTSNSKYPFTQKETFSKKYHILLYNYLICNRKRNICKLLHLIKLTDFKGLGILPRIFKNILENITLMLGPY